MPKQRPLELVLMSVAGYGVMPSRKRPAPPKGDTNIRPRWSSRLGAWVFDVTYPRWERGFRSLPEARRARNAMRSSADEGTLTRAPARMTVGDLVLKRWLPSKQSELTNKSSIYRCQRAAVLIDEGLGKIALRKLTPLDIEDWKQSLTKQFNPGSSANYYGRLREVLKWAIDHDLLHKSPASRVRPPKVTARKTPALELGQIRKLVEVADATPYGLLVWLAISTGLRVGELLSLTWSRVDMAEHTLHADSKTDAGNRIVALAPVTVERLQIHRWTQERDFTKAGLPPPTLVFLNDRGTQVLKAWWWWRWNAIRSAAGLPTLKFHGLRHIHATLMGKAGVHPSVIQERLGHATPGLSQQVYVHNSAGQQVAAAEAVEALISGPSLQKTEHITHY